MTLTAHTTLHGLPVEIASIADGQEVSEIEIIPAGEFALNDGRGAFRLADPSAFIAASLEFARVHAGGKILVDFDHGSERKGDAKATAAAGWIEALRHDAAGGRMMATVRWTRAGRAALSDGSYRFISPVFAHGKTREVLGIVRAGLTNTPAISGMEPVAASAQHEETDMDKLAEIAKALGLKEGATEADIVAAATQAMAVNETALAVLEAAGVKGELDDTAITALAAKLEAASAGAGEPDPAKYVPRAMFDELSTKVTSIEAATAQSKAEGLVAAAREAGKLPPSDESLAWARSYAAKDPAGFEAWSKAAPVVCASGELLPSLKPAEGGQGTLTAAEKQVCATMGVSEADFIAMRDGKSLPKKEA